MRAANTYRGARRNEARALGLIWRTLDRTGLSNGRFGPGTIKVEYPFKKNGKLITPQAQA